MTAVAGGDRAALARLYQRYAGVLLALGLRICGQRREAEDLVHDVFVEVWQQAGTYDRSRGTVKSWMFLRLRSRAIDRLRAAGQRSVSLDELPDRAETTAEDPSLSPDRQRVRRALADLPEAQRAALHLAYFAGMSGSEIAEHLGVPLGTIKTRVAAGLARLRTAMAGSGGEP